jgi:hypothetical protein
MFFKESHKWECVAPCIMFTLNGIGSGKATSFWKKASIHVIDLICSYVQIKHEILNSLKFSCEKEFVG